MSRLTPSLRDTTLRWLADDPDPDTRAELQRLLASAMAGDEAATAEVAARMAGPLRFGTAGVRGPVRAGLAGMNVAVVRRTTAGLAGWLRARGQASGVVVVGRDARHGSEAFCAAAAGVLAAAGFDVQVLPSPLPTPVLAFAVQSRAAVAGVQITASHNPPADNGYKVYTSDGAQLAPPADAEIEALIALAPPAVSIPVSAEWTTLGTDLLESYLDRIGSLPRGTARSLRVVATPLHGVGGETLVHALRRAGFTDVRIVPTQARPDPDFPTVTFPNPEEPGATDALLDLASDVDADLAVALDPDGDRCALGVSTPDGDWRMLSGDETGVLLGERVLATVDAVAHPDPLVATTVVSSSMLAAIAAAHGARFAQTLTGFKWIVRAGTGLIYGYEEALGLCVDPEAVRDKDGISAATLACDLAATLKAAGRTLLDALDELAIAHGVHLTEGRSLLMGPAAQLAAMQALHAGAPATLAGVPVGVEHPAPDVVVLRGDGQRVVIRPSGTEPKLKYYLEVVEPVTDPGGLAAARQRAVERMGALRDAVGELLGAGE